MICNGCNNEAKSIRGRFINGKYVENCEQCGIITTGVKGYEKGVVAIYTDNKGNTIPVDKRGNIVEAHNNPYQNDSRGWKHAGKKKIKY